MDDDALARLLDVDAPPADAATLAAVVHRRDRLRHRRHRLVSTVSLALAVGMAGALAVDVSGGHSMAPAAARPRAAAARVSAAAALPPRSSSRASSRPRGRGLVHAAAAAPSSPGPLALAWLGRAGPASVRAFVAPPAGLLAASSPPRAATGAKDHGATSAPSCTVTRVLVVEVAERWAVGRLVLRAVSARRTAFAGAAVDVIGTREGAPLEVVAARAPEAATGVVVRFDDGHVARVAVHGGWAVAVDPLAGGGVPVGLTLRALGPDGATVARASIRSRGTWLPSGCVPTASGRRRAP